MKRRWVIGAWALLALASLARPARAQLLPVLTSAHLPGEIDSLRTPGQINRWMHRINRYAGPVDTLPTYPNGKFGKRGLPPLAPWIKADFDGNGYTDLLVLSRGRECPTPRLFLTLGARRYREIWWPNPSYDCHLPLLTRVDGRPALWWYHVVEVPDKRVVYGSVSRPRLDTLVYRFGGFLEYNARPVPRRIEHLSFAAEACYGDCPVFTLDIAADGQARYHEKDWPSRGPRSLPVGWFSTRIDSARWAELQDLLAYLPLPTLSGDYAIGATDHATVQLLVSYDGGQQLRVTDYGLMGTAGLALLYEKLYQLRRTQSWQPTLPPEPDAAPTR